MFMFKFKYLKTITIAGIIAITGIFSENAWSQTTDTPVEKSAVENPIAEKQTETSAAEKNVTENPATKPAEIKKAEPAAPEAIVLGGFRQSFRQYSPATGWRYLWNASGAIGQSAHYRSLIWNRRGSYVADATFPAEAPAKSLMLDILSGCPGQSSSSAPDKLARYVIIAYTLKENSNGNVWLTDGNIMKPIGGDEDTIELRIYVNNTLKYSSTVSTGETPELFQQDLGVLAKGDTIYVAAGPDENDAEDMFHLDFNLKILPSGTTPEAPLNLIKPPADEPEVKRLHGGKPSPAFLKKHEELLKQAAAVKPDVVFLGDSITSGWMDAGKAIWDQHISVYKPLNLGVSGDRTEHVLWRLANGEADNIKPKVVVLMIGTNNLYMCSVDEICEGIYAILEELQSRQPQSKILLLGILPRAQSPDAGVRTKIKQINGQLAQMADGTDIRFLDFGPSLLEPDGSISEEIMPDFLHLSESGYNTWFDEMSPVLLEMLEPDKS